MELKKEGVVTLSIIGAVVIVALLLTGVVLYKKSAREAANNAANHALSVEEGSVPYTDLSGNIVELTEYVGRILVINAWASWSPDSARELPALAELAKKYADKNVVVLAINRAEPQTTAERYLKTVGAADTVHLVLDPDDRFYKSVGGYAMPETIFYDRKGNIVEHHHGVLTEEEMTGYLEQIIAADTTE